MNQPPEQRSVLRITLQALPDIAPACVRLKRLLKYALRGLRLRCLRVEEITQDGQESPINGQKHEGGMGKAGKT